jgi:hypothetical protein
LLALAVSMTAGGQEPGESRARKPGDKRYGEEEQIRARAEWFIRSRGLDQLERAGALRARAAEETALRTSLDAGLLANWTSVGPESMSMLSWTMGRVAGRVAALAVHPTDENTIYLGAASGGLWKTINGGASWTSQFDAVGTQTIGSLALDPSNANTLWVGTGEQSNDCIDYFGMGVFRSTDGGATFQARNGSAGTSLDLSWVTALGVQPGNSNVVLAGGLGYCSGGSEQAGGLYRSTDAGTSWTRVLNGPVQDVVFDPGNGSVAYATVGRGAAAGNGVFKSTNGGASWTLLSNGIVAGSAVARLRLALAPSNSQILYVLANKAAGGTGLYRSLDGGASWTQRNTSACEGQCSYNLCLSVHPTNSDALLVGSIRVFQSTNGGTTLNALTTTWGSSQKVHQDTHVVRYSRTNGNRFWVGSDGGLWRSDDAGVNFANLNSNLNVTQYYDVAVHPTDAARLFGGAQDNSSSARTTSQFWAVTVVTGDGFMNLVDPGNPNYVFQTSYPSGGPSVYRSTTGGTPNSFTRLSTSGIGAGESFPWVTQLAIVPNTTSSTVFVASNFVYRADARQSTWSWTKISSSLSGTVSALGPFAAGGTPTLYAGTDNGLIHRTDNALAASVSWSNVTGNFPGGWVSDLAVDPANRLRVFATRSAFGGAKLYRSTTGGGTWQAAGAGLPDVPANAVAIDPLNGQRVFVGTDTGVFVSEDGGDTFSAAMAGFPQGTVVTDLEIDDSPYILTAGTYGRGAWQLALAGSGNTAPSVAISAPASGTSVTAGTSVTFTGSATDVQDGSLSASLSWTSSRDGVLGTGASLSTSALSVGSHTITAAVTDSGGLTGSASIGLNVVGLGGGAQTATYDATLRAPKCASVGVSCDSGASLLLGRGTLGPEPNQPNTIGASCADGTSGTFHSDESNDRIKVSTVDGTNLAAGKQVRIDATVWAWTTPASDKLDLYYAANANSPTWTFLTTLTPAAAGAQTLSATYTLPAGALQAVRAQFRYQGTVGTCTTGGYQDRDDLIFAVQ